MDRERWSKVKVVLGEVLVLADEDRRAYLDSALIADETRSEVESLLSRELEADSFLSIAAGSFSTDILCDYGLLAPSSIFGVYEVIRELGIGGMGAVYLAERRDGKFDQKVAIKLLKREFNIGHLRQMFDREIDILSRLVHPNIAQILDTGVTNDGVPYIVMEYVSGLPMDRFCKENRLDLVARLKLFIRACDAISFAHQNLIVHRDLKPSNIVVTADGIPKLLDFGISKLLDGSDPAVMTMLGAMTPEYASPEQIAGEPVNTTSDIYSLGVVLYKLLTGRNPFGHDGKTNGDLRRAITQDEPFAPSQAPGEVSSQTFSASQLSGDIDNIVLKALSKEPERRYQTADAFAADIWRYIDGLPILARPASASYRAHKFFKRNRIAVSAVAVVLLSLIAGVAVASWQASVARVQAADAHEARSVAENESERSKIEQAKAEKITRYMSKIISYANPAWYAEGYRFGGDATVLEALDDLSEKIDIEFAGEPDVAAELHSKFSEVFHFVGQRESDPKNGRFWKKRNVHALRALELRKQVYGEWHELVAKDLFGTYEIMEAAPRERADQLMRAILMMRDTNPHNLNLPYMFEAYTANLILPGYTERAGKDFRDAVLPPTDQNNYQIAEQMLRESLPVFRLHYKPDNSAVFSAECKLAYALAVQEKWLDVEEHYAICKQYGERSELPGSAESRKYFADLVENLKRTKSQ